MRTRKVMALIGAAVATAVVFFCAGRLTRGGGGWERQHVNKSSDSKEFCNSFLGLTARAPEGHDWELVWEPAQFHLAPVGVNKVLEINRTTGTGSGTGQVARMDVFVEPVGGSGSVLEVLERLEFRGKRPGFRVVANEATTIGGREGSVRVAEWAVRRRKYRSVNYYAEHRGRLYAFIGVCEARGFGRLRPTFDGIVSAVRLD